jgi:ATP:cob(I)alamin adenosyltransferase
MTEDSRKIYTRFGDRGRTKLLSGETIAKDDLRVNTYGAVDELQSHLGLARSLTGEAAVRSVLFAVQRDLFVAGAELASTPEGVSQLGHRITTRDVTRLETWIDEMTERYGMPGGFLVPGASTESAALHLARAVCRRVERLIIRLHRSTGTYEEMIIYFNRLSDLLFVLAWSSTVLAAVEGVLNGWAPAFRDPTAEREN